MVAFFELPRELRDEIYGHIFSAPRYSNTGRSRNFSILQTSKRASNEAVQVLYPKCVFRLYLDIRDMPHTHASFDASHACFSQQTAYLIGETTIDLIIKQYNEPSDLGNQRAIEQSFQRMLVRLLQLNKARRTCTITLMRNVQTAPQFNNYWVIEALKELSDFSVVIVRYQSVPKRLRMLRNSVIPFTHPYGEVTTMIQNALEPYLGLASPYQESNEGVFLCLKFEPWKNLAEAPIKGKSQ